MTVTQLIKRLSKLNPDAQIILQRDPEGNGYSPISCAEKGYYLNGDVYSASWTPGDCCMEEDEHAKMVASEKAQCVVLAPMY